MAETEIDKGWMYWIHTLDNRVLGRGVDDERVCWMIYQGGDQ